MNIRKSALGSSLGGCACSLPGRPPVASRGSGGGDFGQRLWRARASEDAAVGVGIVPQAVGTRWFRKAGGMPPSMFGLTAKPLCGRCISRLRSVEEISTPSRSGLSRCRRSLAGSGRVASTISRELAAQRRHPKRRPRVSCDDSAMARRAALLAAQSRRSLRATRR